MLGFDIDLENPLFVSIFIYVFVIFLLYIIKPKLCFGEDNQIKIFGCTRENNTLFTFPIIATIIAIITYFSLTILKIA